MDEAKKRVVLGMSGGVDSSTSATFLMDAGYEVIGATCLFIDEPSSKAAVRDAAQVCDQLGISHHRIDGLAAFEKNVINAFVDDYASGLTPSPCVGCNAFCKIPNLIQIADELGCEKVATGHYARIARLEANGRYVVKAALDTSKDQSYMLSQLTQDQLSRLIFPLGAMTKTEVRCIAEDTGLSVAQKAESQDICFIEGSHLDFLQESGVKNNPGDIVTKEGKVVGRHEGLHAYTIGQRKGIGIAAPEPYYVIGKDKELNRLIVGYKKDTMISKIEVTSLNWQAFEHLEEDLECMVKLRYRSTAVACVVKPGEDSVRVELQSAQATTAPGQFAVFYMGETVLGSGVISSVE